MLPAGGGGKGLGALGDKVRRACRQEMLQTGAFASCRGSGGALTFVSACSQVAQVSPHERADKNGGAPPSNSRMRPGLDIIRACVCRYPGLKREA